MENRSIKNTPLDLDKWRGLVKAWQSSGETQNSYCLRLGLNKNTFSYVRNKLLNQKQAKTRFIPVAIKNEAEVMRPSLVVLEKPDGYKLNFSASLPIEQLTRLFQLSGW